MEYLIFTLLFGICGLLGFSISKQLNLEKRVIQNEIEIAVLRQISIIFKNELRKK